METRPVPSVSDVRRVPRCPGLAAESRPTYDINNTNNGLSSTKFLICSHSKFTERHTASLLVHIFWEVYSTLALSTALYVNNLLTIANRRLNLLIFKRNAGVLSPPALDKLFTRLSHRDFYIKLAAFSGYLSYLSYLCAANISRFNAFFCKARS